MSLVDGLILHTLDQKNKVSQHNLLMQYYKLEKQIDIIERWRWRVFESFGNNLNLVFYLVGLN